MAGIDDVKIVLEDSGVLRITLDRPERRNALTVPMMDAIRAALERTHDDHAIRLVSFTGAGDRAFCAGADLSDEDTPFKPDFARLNQPFADMLRAGHRCAVPILCVFNGACVAGGMGFLGLCDIAIAATTARFGMPEVKVGIFPMQIVAVLRDLIPRRLMADLSYSGRMMGAEEALSHGLLNEIHPPADLDRAAREMEARLAAASPAALRRGRYALREMAHMSFEQMIAFAETQVGPMISTGDAAEGRRAFLEKRPPVWKSA